MEPVFRMIYENNLWGNNQNPAYRGSSGPGSEVDYNKTTYIPFLQKFIREHQIKTIVDLGCGDFRCGPLIYEDLNDISYTGYDLYQKVVAYNSSQYALPKYSFLSLDFCNNKESIIGGDLCILKDVLQHWSLANIYSFLDYLVQHKKFKYILICNCCHQTADALALNETDIHNGEWRQLTCDLFPLKKYNPKKLYNYQTKEVSVIDLTMEAATV